MKKTELHRASTLTVIILLAAAVLLAWIRISGNTSADTFETRALSQEETEDRCSLSPGDRPFQTEVRHLDPLLFAFAKIACCLQRG